MHAVKKLMPICAAVCLAGCSWGVSKQELLKNPDMRSKKLVLAKNYQALVKCWDDNADRGNLGTSNNIYPELGQAEIIASYGEYHYVLLNLKKIDENHTVVNAYGQGWTGETYIPKWLATLRICAKS